MRNGEREMHKSAWLGRQCSLQPSACSVKAKERECASASVASRRNAEQIEPEREMMMSREKSSGVLGCWRVVCIAMHAVKANAREDSVRTAKVYSVCERTNQRTNERWLAAKGTRCQNAAARANRAALARLGSHCAHFSVCSHCRARRRAA